jgi:hypothetical protein
MRECAVAPSLVRCSCWHIACSQSLTKSGSSKDAAAAAQSALPLWRSLKRIAASADAPSDGRPRPPSFAEAAAAAEADAAAPACVGVAAMRGGAAPGAGGGSAPGGRFSPRGAAPAPSGVLLIAALPAPLGVSAEAGGCPACSGRGSPPARAPLPDAPSGVEAPAAAPGAALPRFSSASFCCSASYSLWILSMAPRAGALRAARRGSTARRGAGRAALHGAVRRRCAPARARRSQLLRR